MLCSLLVGIGVAQHVGVGVRTAEEVMPAGRSADVKPAGTTTDGTYVRKVLIVARPSG